MITIGKKTSPAPAYPQRLVTPEPGAKSASRAITAAPNDGVDSQLDAAQVRLGMAPPLPAVSGPSDHGYASTMASWLSDLGDGVLMWLAMSELARTSMRDMKDAQEVRRVHQNAKVAAKGDQIRTIEQQQSAERQETALQLASSVVLACATVAVSYVGYKVGQGNGGAAGDGVQANESGSELMGKAIINSGRLISDIGQAGVNMASKGSGPQRRADEKKLEAMRWEQQSEMLDQLIEEASSNHEHAKELFKKALAIVTEHYELQTQATQTLTRG